MKRRAEEVVPDVCSGCAKPPQPHTKLRQVAVGLSTKVWLCEGRGWARRNPAVGAYRDGESVSATCLRRVRDRLALCPGCGKENQEPGTICDGCYASLARDREATQQELRVYRICTNYILGPYAGGEHQRVIEKAAWLLARSVAGRRFWPNGNIDFMTVGGTIGGHENRSLAADPCAELTDGQAKALAEFSEAIGEAMEAQHAAGKEEGRNLLLGLARGEMTTSDYEERIEVRRRR